MTLREQILSRAILPPGVEDGTDRVRCVVMDWEIGGHVVTLAAFDDDTTSLYYSSGGGIIGAGARQSVREAAAAFRAEAERVRTRFRAVSEHPPPEAGGVVFYLVTDRATLSSGPAPATDLAAGNHPLSALGNAAQRVIMRIRAASETAREDDR